MLLKMGRRTSTDTVEFLRDLVERWARTIGMPVKVSLTGGSRHDVQCVVEFIDGLAIAFTLANCEDAQHRHVEGVLPRWLTERFNGGQFGGHVWINVSGAAEEAEMERRYGPFNDDSQVPATDKVAPRPLSANERCVLQRVVDGLGEPFGERLSIQIDQARVTGGFPLVLDIEVDGGDVVEGLPDGPLPIRGVTDSGEVLVWMEAGQLSGLEFAWWSDEAPTAIPPADSIRFNE